MEIIKKALQEMMFSPYNPKDSVGPGHAIYEKIKRSILEFGFILPLIFNIRTGYIVGGNQRYRVLCDLGFTEAEVVIVDLPLEKEKLLSIALNQIRDEFDLEKLAVILDELTKIPSFDVALAGFETSELSEILDNYLEPSSGEDGFEEDPDLIKNPITQRGDIIFLGDHRIMCGDATSEEDLNKLLAGVIVILIVMDWPYNVDYMGGSCPRVDARPKKSRKWDRIYSDNMPQSEYEAFMRKVLINIKAHLKLGAAFYQWQAHRQLGPLYQILTELDFHVACLICWAKESAAISYADYSFATEQAVYGWLKGASHYFAGEPGESNLWQVKRDPTKAYEHPCQKPIELSRRAIKNSSKRDEVVLDVFLGSGSALIASEVLGRRCFGLELDPAYCDVIVRRFIKFAPDKVSEETKARYLTVVKNGN